MNPSWHSLYMSRSDGPAIADAFRTALQASGYRLYDPFPGGSGLSFGWKQRVRHFVAPAAGAVTRVLGEPALEALPAVAAALGGPVLHVWLAEDGAGLAVWTADGRDESAAGLAAWRRDGVAPDALRRALDGHAPAAPLAAAGPQVMAVPLPHDVQAMAESVDPGQAEKMMDRLTRQVFGKFGGGQSQQAGAALLGGAVDWNAAEGRRLRAVMACLAVPVSWREPSLAEVRESFQVARGRRHNPDGLRLPGDDDSLARVPDALQYIPVYAGKR